MVSRSWRIALRPVWLAVLTMALIVPASVLATTNEPIAQTGGMTATFPLLGTSLTVGVALDEIGDIDTITLDPADALPTTTTGEHGTTYTNEEGTAKVSVKAKGDKLEIKAKTTLADLLGPGSWSANVFGAGTEATVTYTIGADADGKPTIVIDEVTVPSGVGFVVKAAHADAKHGKHGGKHGASATAAVVFSSDGFVKTLRLSVGARKDGSASLKITLSGKDRQKLQGTLEELAGPRTWTAHLCDGTPVEVAYHVTDAGAVEFDSVSGAPASVKERPHGFKVRFDGERVGVQVKLKSRGDGTYQLKVDGRSGQCGGKHDDGEGKDAQKHRDDHGSKGSKGDKGRSSERHGDRRGGGSQHGGGR